MSHAVGKTPGSSFGVKMVYYDNAAEGVVCILPHDGVDSESDCDRFIAWVLRATIGDSIGCERARKELEKKWGVAPPFQLHLRGYVVRGDDRNPRHDGSTHEFDSFHAVVNERLYMPDGRRRALDDMLVPTSVRQFHPFADVRRGVAGEYLGTTLALRVTAGDPIVEQDCEVLRNPWDSDVLWYIWNPDEVIVRLRLPVIPSNQRNDGGEAYVREVFQRLAQKLRGFSPQLDDITIHDPESWRSLFENTHSAEDGSDWR